jgi:hypothetical protein
MSVKGKGIPAKYTPHSPARRSRQRKNSPSGHAANRLIIKKMIHMGDSVLNLPSILKRDKEDIELLDAKMTEYNALLYSYNKTLQYYKKRLCSHDFTAHEYKKMTDLYTKIKRLYDTYEMVHDKLERGASLRREQLRLNTDDEAARAAVAKIESLPLQSIKQPEKPENPSWSRWVREKLCYSQKPDDLGMKRRSIKRNRYAPKKI